MFDVGFWELVILFGLGLLVLGPERLPKVAAQVGEWAGNARRMARTLTTQIRSELDMDQTATSYKRPPPPGAGPWSPASDTPKPTTPGDETVPDTDTSDDPDPESHP